MGTLTMREAWHKPGWGSVAVRGLTRPRVTDAAGECPVLYYPAGLPEDEVDYIHAYAILALFRMRYGDEAWLRALCDYDAIYRATSPPWVREDAAD